jgi:hypothetical protein
MPDQPVLVQCRGKYFHLRGDAKQIILLLQKSPATARKSRQRSAQLKLAGIATDQSELSVQADESQSQQKQQQHHQSGNTPA